MNITFITPYFPPEVGAPQTRIWTFATWLTRRGHAVTVSTGLPHYPSGIVPREYRGKLFIREDLDGLRVLRGWVYAAPNKGFFRRLLDQASFAISAVPVTLQAEKPDVIIVESPPLFSGWPGYLVSRWRSAPFILYVSDLWPDSAIEMGVLRNSLLIRLARWMEELFYRKAARVVAVTRGIEDRLRKRGLPDTKVVLIPNGVDTSRFLGVAPGSWREQWNTGERFLVLYAGTHGLAQGLDSVVRAAALLRDQPIQFVFVGDGAEKNNLKAETARLGVRNVLFADSVPAKAIPSLLASADCCLVSLRGLKIFQGAVPSKMYEAMASGKPTMLVAEGEAVQLLERAEGGVAVPPGSPEGLAEALQALSRDPAKCRRLGENARNFVRENHDFEALTSRLENVLFDVCRCGTRG